MKITRRHALAGFAALSSAAALGSTKPAIASRPATAFGTTVRLTVKAATSADAEAGLDAGFEEVRAVERAFNLFDPQSELSLLNANGELLRPSALMRDVMRLTDEMHRLTDGAFDPCVQPLWLVWQKALRNASTPSFDEIKRADRDVTWQNVENRSDILRLASEGMALTFNGIAQGYAADRVMAAIQPFASSAIIDTGEFGLVAANEKPKLAIRHPRKPDHAVGYITASSGFIASSGDYATAFTPDFQHHHIFDPATGESPRELSAVTVLAPTGAAADALATAFMVMGSHRSLRLVESLAGVATVVITKKGEVFLSSGMKGIFEAA